MNAAPYRKGTLELLPPRSRPVVEYFQRAPAPEGDTACHYCLETLSALEVKSLKRRTCPICRHSLLATLCGIPVHRLDRPQQWTLLANEMQYIWEWKFRLFRSYQEYFGQHLQVFRTTQYSDEKAEFECLNDTLSIVLERREDFLRGEGELDAQIAAFVKDQCEGGGGLGDALSRGHDWREEAKTLSAQGAAPREIAEFQWDLVRGTSWGAFGSHVAQEETLRLLEARMSRG